MSELPKGWIITRLGEVISDYQAGFASGMKDVEGGLPHLRMNNIGVRGELVLDLIRTVPDSLSQPHHFLEKGDVLVCTTNSSKLVGKCTLFDLNGRYAFSNHLTRLRPMPELVIGSYLMRYLWVLWQSGQFEDKCKHWVNQSALPKEQLLKTPILLPPLNEQRRIEAKLETLLGKVDICQQRLVKFPRLLKRFRQAVLAAACSGRLTADWREENSTVEPASELFTIIQAERQRRYHEECEQAIILGQRKPKHPDSNKQSRNTVGDLPEIPKTWEYYRLEELSHLVTDGTHKTPQYVEDGKPFLSVKNVRPFLIRDVDIKHITEKEHLFINSRCNPERGDILYTKVGATFGYAAENRLDYPFSIFVSLALIKPVKPFFTSAYTELVMNSETVFAQARERVTGIGTPDLHLIEIRDFRVPLPPLAEQQEIVRRVQDFFRLADQLEARYHKAKAHVDKLTQSILAKAFRGEIVPQDPQDEPAAVLLERIRAKLDPRQSSTAKSAKRAVKAHE